jgi:hypothetical protein
VHFRILGPLTAVETIATGRGIREIARIRLSDGTVRLAEIHWYEATGIGRREYKIKRYIE